MCFCVSKRARQRSLKDAGKTEWKRRNAFQITRKKSCRTRLLRTNFPPCRQAAHSSLIKLKLNGDLMPFYCAQTRLFFVLLLVLIIIFIFRYRKQVCQQQEMSRRNLAARSVILFHILRVFGGNLFQIRVCRDGRLVKHVLSTHRRYKRQQLGKRMRRSPGQLFCSTFACVLGSICFRYESAAMADSYLKRIPPKHAKYGTK